MTRSQCSRFTLCFVRTDLAVYVLRFNSTPWGLYKFQYSLFNSHYLAHVLSSPIA